MSTSINKKTHQTKKPIYYGIVFEKSLFKKAIKVTGVLLIMLVFHLIFGPMLIFENKFLRISLNSILFFIDMGILYMSGISLGESDAVRGEIIYRQIEQGHQVSKVERKSSFNTFKGFITSLLGMLPFLIIATILSMAAEKTSYILGSLPSWVANYSDNTLSGLALEYYKSIPSFTYIDGLRAVVRIILLPVYSMLNYNKEGIYLLEKLSPVFIIGFSIVYGLGYIRGKRVRDAIHTSIGKNKRKKRRKVLPAKRKKTSDNESKMLV